MADRLLAETDPLIGFDGPRNTVALGIFLDHPGFGLLIAPAAVRRSLLVAPSPPASVFPLPGAFVLLDSGG